MTLTKIALIAAGFALIGCEAAPTPTPVASVRPDVTDIRPLENPTTPAAYAQPVTDAPAPVVTVEPPAKSVALVDTTGTPTTGGKTHRVRRGETAFAIARTTYGDGKQWKRIAAANPSVDLTKLRVGQDLVMP